MDKVLKEQLEIVGYTGELDLDSLINSFEDKGTISLEKPARSVKWIASYDYVVLDDREKTAEMGDTPVEAISRLYIKLNK